MVSLRNRKVTVAGLGKFGGNIAAARWLVEQGAHVLVTDQSSVEKLKDSVAQLADLPIEWRLGEHREIDFTSADLIVASPAIPPTNPYLLAARSAGVPVTTEIALFIERCLAPIVGITGTKGKSTTTAMLGDMLKNRFTTYVGGNIGKSLLGDLPRITAHDMVVLELSSFMLDYLREAKWSPHIAVITMLAEDHLDWHGSAQAYRLDKRSIVEFQKPEDFAMLDQTSADFAKHTSAKVVWFDRNIIPLQLGIPGKHNQLNAQAALAVACALGVNREDAIRAAGNFRGLDHRLKLIHEAGGVKFYDDSIATIPQAAVAAMEAFAPHTVLQIIGGSDKKLEYSAMCRAIAQRAKAALCIGATGNMLAAAIQEFGGVAHRCGTLERAVEVAREDAVAGDVVLLSTGYASYDQFSNFQDRGQTFERLVKGL